MIDYFDNVGYNQFAIVYTLIVITMVIAFIGLILGSLAFSRVKSYSSNNQSIQGPAGPRGIQGIQGVQGPTGPQGSPGIMPNGFINYTVDSSTTILPNPCSFSSKGAGEYYFFYLSTTFGYNDNTYIPVHVIVYPVDGNGNIRVLLKMWKGIWMTREGCCNTTEKSPSGKWGDWQIYYPSSY